MLAYRIRKARMTQGFKQRELAELLGKTRTSVVNWETDYSRPSDDLLEKIADVLHVDVEWLNDDSDDEFEKMEVESLKRNNDDLEEDESLRAHIGRRLRYLRKGKGLTQEELASQLLITNTVISGYESGRREPDAETLLRFAQFFEVSLDDLFGYRPGTKKELIHITPWLYEVIEAPRHKQEALKQIWKTIEVL